MKFDFLRIIGIPLLFAMLNVFFRLLGRHNEDESATRNNYAIATSLLLLVLSKTTSDIYLCISLESPNTTKIFEWILALLVLTVFSAVWDRFYSWIPGSKKKATYRGIIIPDIIAFIAFIVYQFSAVSLLK